MPQPRETLSSLLRAGHLLSVLQKRCLLLGSDLWWVTLIERREQPGTGRAPPSRVQRDFRCTALKIKVTHYRTVVVSGA